MYSLGFGHFETMFKDDWYICEWFWKHKQKKYNLVSYYETYIVHNLNMNIRAMCKKKKKKKCVLNYPMSSEDTLNFRMHA